MKKLLPVLFLFVFTNLLLGQVGLQLQKTNGNDSNEIKIDGSGQDLGIFFLQENKAKLPTDLKYYFLSDQNSLNFSNSGFRNSCTKMELAFFCKIEADIESSSKIPVRFRLGEVQAVDQKEGKWQQFSH